MAIRVSCDINKRLIGWLNLVLSACWVLKLLSWFDALENWSRAALAEDTFWFCASFLREWIHVEINRDWRFRLVFNNCFIVKRQPIQMYRHGSFFLPFPWTENRRAFFNFDWKLAQLRTNASAETPYLLIQRQISFWVRFKRPMTGSFQVEVFSVYDRAIFPRCENLLQNINYVTRSYLKITRLLLYTITLIESNYRKPQ